MNIQARIKKWGNSLALRLSGPMCTIPHFTADMLVNVNVSEKGIEIRPAVKRRKGKLPFTEADLLDGLTAKKAHADELVNISDKELGE